MTVIQRLVLTAVSLSLLINSSFAVHYKVSRLVILTDKLTPDLFRAIEIDEYYLSKKATICKAYTNEQIESCLKTFEAKEVWYVYLGHSDGKKIGDFLSVETIKFPKKVDYIILDACNLGNNPKLKRLLGFTRKGIFAVKGQDPYLGMLPLYKDNWKSPKQAINLLRAFYKDNPQAPNFIFISH